ncbi:aspartic peptidase domain-containing protein [Radiomyces spectabilis]|uniref:aspartic peptidase domain-containing protein n=1 Tax=Radiomyces spectabilis TaxID=64574 RepID=UPI002220C7B1|nr:aspartic peptidase domain-containing protein [Radiomyces spectabilis]KAI8391545.1 aspartic peptidase domain-containing protein [Radiomyces spectabilis]
MLQHLIRAWIIAWFCISATALTIPARRTDSSNTIRLSLTAETATNTRSNRFHRRNQAHPYTIPLHDQHHVEYLANISVGTPSQYFMVSVDTGSADLWVPFTDCPQEQCPFTRFTSAKSSTYRDLNITFEVQYGSGSASGKYATDVVSMGNATIPKQQLGMVNDTDKIVPLGSYARTIALTGGLAPNGVMGFAFPGLTCVPKGTPSYNPFIFNLIQENLISEPLFSLSFYDALGSSNAELMMGGIDKSRYLGSISYVPVTQLVGSYNPNEAYGYWMVNGQGVSIIDTFPNGTSLLHDQRFPYVRGIIFDTGTTLTYMDRDLADSLMKNLNIDFHFDDDVGLYAVDCAIRNSTQQVEFQVSDRANISTTPVHIRINVRQLFLPSKPSTKDEDETCYFSIAAWPEDKSSSTILLGNSLLRYLYLVFDMGNKRVGIATPPGVQGGIIIPTTLMSLFP